MVKPHLYRCDGWWVCHSTERTDYGSTPQYAYQFWQYWIRQQSLGYRAP
jgi:hypothetical protein